MKKVIIAIPVYNMGQYIEETLISCLEQDYKNIDIHIIDNCSDDDTEVVVSKFIHLENVYYIRNNSNIGMVGNWNKCLTLQGADFIKILCSDDILMSNYVSSCIKIFESNPEVVLVASEFEHFGKVNFHHYFPKILLDIAPQRKIFECMYEFDNYIGSPSNVILKVSAIKGLKFDMDFPYAPDWLYWAQVSNRGAVYFLRKKLCRFRRHDDQTTSYLKSTEVQGKISTIEKITQFAIQEECINQDVGRLGLFYYGMKMVRYSASNRPALMNILRALNLVRRNFTIRNIVSWGAKWLDAR